MVALVPLLPAASVSAAAGTHAGQPRSTDHHGRRPPAQAGYVPPRNPPANVTPPFRLAGALCTEVGSVARCDNPCADPAGVLAGKPPALNSSARCTADTVKAIDHARALEHVGPLLLPRNWSRLSVAEQLFVIADLERVARGVPPLVGLVPALSRFAAAGARAATDPEFPLSAAEPGPETSNWSGNDYSVLIADYEWMYQDGWGAGGGNVDCTGQRAPGCWGHRDNILGAGTGTTCAGCLMGAAFAANARGWGTSFAELFIAPGHARGLTPTFTWKKDVVPQLPR